MGANGNNINLISSHKIFRWCFWHDQQYAGLWCDAGEVLEGRESKKSNF